MNNRFDVGAFLDDEEIGYTKTETTYKGKPCTKYTLKYCPFDESHLGPDSVIFQYENGNIAFKCLHDSCKDKKWADVSVDCRGQIPRKCRAILPFEVRGRAWQS